MGFEELRVAVPGGEIFATRRGEGPGAILLHGGPGVGAENIIGLVEELDGLVNSVLPQQRGLYTSTLEGPRDVETHVADDMEELDKLGWERAWLIGHSWGGHLAMHIAVAHPDRVTGLILIETLGALPDGGSAELVANMVARLTAEERASLDELVARQTEGDDDRTLSRAVGHLPDTPLPWESGNVGLAGHRDSFFRGLKAVRKDDKIVLKTLKGEYQYVVDSLKIVSPDDISVLRTVNAENALTLVTCYPFNYVGHAPKRFIVRARQVSAPIANKPETEVAGGAATAAEANQ